MLAVSIFLIDDAPSPKKKRRIKVRRKNKDKMIMKLEAAERELRDLGFLDLDAEEEYKCPSCGSLLEKDSENCSVCGVKFEEEEMDYECPKCNFVIEIEANFCPKCGNNLENEVNKGIEKVSKEKAKIVFKPDSDSAPLKENFDCPICGADIFATTQVCPDCEYKLDENVEEFNCPNCGHKVYACTTSCPRCKINLDE